MKCLSVTLATLYFIVIGCVPTVPETPPWLLAEGQYVFIETTTEVDSVVVDGKPAPGQNVDMPTYDFDGAAGVLKSRAGFMPPKDAKVIIGLRRTLRGPVGAGASSVLTAYSSLPAGTADMIQVEAVDGDAAARLNYHGQVFILKPSESKEFNATETQAVTGGIRAWPAAGLRRVRPATGSRWRCAHRRRPRSAFDTACPW